MRKKIKIQYVIIAISLFFVIALNAYALFDGNIAQKTMRWLEETDGNARYLSENDLKKELAGISEKLAYLEEQINFLRQENISLKEQVENKSEETIKREIAREKSQEDLLTEAVAEITPSVVSIVATKDVPLLEIEYINPFGDDPFYNNFGFRIPRYIQKGTTKKEISSGTGFIATQDGKLITNRHVVSDTEAEYTVLLQDGKQKTASVIYRDQKNDIAILKIEGSGYPTAALGDSSNLKLGQTVFAVGNALGEYSNSVSVGIISGLNRNIEASGEKINNVIQTDAAINPGNSGGPLVNLNKEVIGINVATVIGSDNISFSIPINVAKEVLKLTN